jgi:hypothetical protein
MRRTGHGFQAVEHDRGHYRTPELERESAIQGTFVVRNDKLDS